MESPEAMLQALQSYKDNGGDLNDPSLGLPEELKDMLQSMPPMPGGAFEGYGAPPPGYTTGGAMPGQQMPVQMPGQQQEVPTEEVTPKPGFVIKTADDTGRKVFINLCHSDKIKAPGGWEGGVPEEVVSAVSKEVDDLSQSEQELLRFPLATDTGRNELDRSGVPCSVYDCIVATEVMEGARSVRQLKLFLIELALKWISHKHKKGLDGKFKLPKMKYKGSTIQSQRIRVDPKKVVMEVKDVATDPEFALRTRKAKAQPARAASNSQAVLGKIASQAAKSTPSGTASGASETSSGPASIMDGAPGDGSAVPHGAAASTPRQPTVQEEPPLECSLSFEGSPLTTITIEATLPAQAANPSICKDLQVNVSGRVVTLTVSGTAPARVALPVAVDVRGARAEVRGGRLSLSLPYIDVAGYVAHLEATRPHATGELGLESAALLEGI